MMIVIGTRKNVNFIARECYIAAIDGAGWADSHFGNS